MPRKTTQYLILDCETATLPFVNEWKLTADQKKKIAIAKPLVYDIGWTIANRTHGIVMKRNFLVTEIFSVPAVFDTGYYHDKKPIYLDMLKRGAIELKTWEQIIAILIADMQGCAYVCAYNAMFDFKKAILFTEQYIKYLYSPCYYAWEEEQKDHARYILNNPRKQNEREFDPEHFIFRNVKYPMIDIWGVACIYLLNNSKYKKTCLALDKMSNSGMYFSTNAENAMQYLSQKFDFIEDHTALSDAEIETEILFTALKRGKIVQGIIYFPFKALGNTVDFVKHGKGITKEMALNVRDKIKAYLPPDLEKPSPYHKSTLRQLEDLCGFIYNKWGVV